MTNVIRAQPTWVEQLRTVDRDRVGKPVGHLAAHELDGVEEALKILLGLF
jgi:mRNA-degrading endonuclease toxin of MazEF toxin-antitoxin module